ncbi:hypothetical protein IW262DRAFT_218550 [Armillaria fumosa]|nr:hypothetical protein IW262DRAFT_218550 [Armillaria fumosa]
MLTLSGQLDAGDRGYGSPDKRLTFLFNIVVENSTFMLVHGVLYVGRVRSIPKAWPKTLEPQNLSRRLLSLAIAFPIHSAVFLTLDIVNDILFLPTRTYAATLVLDQYSQMPPRTNVRLGYRAVIKLHYALYFRSSIN